MSERCAATATRRNQRPGGELMSSALALRPRSTHLGLGSCGQGGSGRVRKLVSKGCGAPALKVAGPRRRGGGRQPPATTAARGLAGRTQPLATASRPRHGGARAQWRPPRCLRSPASPGPGPRARRPATATHRPGRLPSSRRGPPRARPWWERASRCGATPPARGGGCQTAGAGAGGVGGSERRGGKAAVTAGFEALPRDAVG